MTNEERARKWLAAHELRRGDCHEEMTLAAEFATARNEALEEAVRAIYDNKAHPMTRKSFADDIRALKAKP